MPIRRFRRIEEMKAPTWRKPGDPELLRVMKYLWEIDTRTRRRRYPPGIHRHSSIEEMQRVQQRWNSEQIGR
jgi:hypothetical protein